MIVAIKILLMLGIVLLLSYPFIPMKGKLRKFSIASSLKYSSPHNRKNIFFVFLAIAEFIVFVIIFKLFGKVASFLLSLPFIGKLFTSISKSVPGYLDYLIFAIALVIVNLIMLYGFIFLKAFVKKAIVNPLFKIGKAKDKKDKKKKKKKNKKKDKDQPVETTESEENSDEEKLRKRRRIPDFLHTLTEDDEEDDAIGKKDTATGDKPAPEKKEYGRFTSKFLSLFFEGDEFQYAKPWVVRASGILQIFIRLVQALYLILLLTVLASVFFPLPSFMYKLLINIIHIKEWYIYPLLSIIFLQEICNIFNVSQMEEPTPEQKKAEEEKEEDRKRDARIRALLAELKKRFDSEHSLRYYPELPTEDAPEYVCTNRMYQSSLEYIRKQRQNEAGHVVQSYMECLDAIFNDSHIYFAASFYSELGEYLIAYSYIRLLSGARMIFVVSAPEQKETLRAYISDRLMRMTGSNIGSGWRVYTADERLDQADILIATPEDFVKENIVDQFPGFFEEACNAVFIDADRMIALDSYVCPVIATRLQHATSGRIRFVFLSLNLIKGFAAGSLPRFFCVDKVHSFSSAKENEAVSFVLWNTESKNRRIYNKSGQRLTSLEAIIAEQAFRHQIDGVRIITEAPLEHAERKSLALHGVEINNLYKNVVDVNYMIYSDDKCNLSAALYACTRFRGRKKSVVHILSKPYLLREYFMSKATTEDHINRSSFIQPRVTEHAERHKLSLLRIFCDATSEKGLPVTVFEKRIRDVIEATRERGDNISSEFCRHMLATHTLSELKLNDLASYMIAGLYDNDWCHTPEERSAAIVASVGNRAKDFYIVVDPIRYKGDPLHSEKYIVFNRVKEVFKQLLECNKRVELRLNDTVIGLLDTFPNRVHLEYIEGQSIIFDNAEYEIERIAKDGSAIYLRHESIGIKHCLDTVLLRKYEPIALTSLEQPAVLNNSTATLEEIRVEKCSAALKATTYGFYSLTSDRQTLDFYSGVEGNPNSETPHVREYTEARVLKLTLSSRIECNDGMRMLLSAAFNEFIRTLFPNAYHCVAICPILSEPLVKAPAEDDSAEDDDSPLARIKTLYPYINNPTEEFIETDPYRMQFLFINDCTEDIGALDWFYDRSARYMQEFLTNVHSYLHWLKLRPEKAHYIYFGGEALPECYDLDTCCELLEGLNLLLSDEGADDFETAGDDTENEKLEYCSFCHKPTESGRFSFFDKHRFICADCFDTVDEQSRLEELYLGAREYLSNTYRDVSFGSAKVAFDPVYNLTLEQILSEFYYRVDLGERTIFVERDNPVNNVSVSLLRGIISLWQNDNSLSNQYSSAQLYYEEIAYLRSINENISADWVYNNVTLDVKAALDEIIDYVSYKDLYEKFLEEKEQNKNEGEGEPAENGEDVATDDNADNGDGAEPEFEIPAGTPVRTSFSFMVMKGKEISEDEWDGEDPEDEDFSNNLYDPNLIPRFWKRCLRGEAFDNGKADEISEDAIGSDEDDVDDGSEDGGDNDMIVDISEPNAPPPEDDLSEIKTEDTPADDKAARKAEKKRQKEEKRRQKQLEWESKLDNLEKEEAIRKGKATDTDSADKDEKDKGEGKKKFSLFGKKKSKNNVEDEPKNEETEEKLDTEDTVENNEIDDKAGDLEPEDKTDNVEPEDKTDNVEPEDKTGDVEPEDKTDTKKDKGKGKNKAEKPKKVKKKGGSRKLSEGERIIPYEEDEKTNPKIRLYNEIARAAYNFSEEPIPLGGVSQDEAVRIFRYVLGDYPELFWVHNCAASLVTIQIIYRFKDANGTLDVKRIIKQRNELRKGAKFFTRGITRKTDPYEALLTIYRRVVFELDYDHVGLKANADRDLSRDDVLRSLYSAIVERKVVCAGYAAAMQYLLQSVGIVCGYVISETDSLGICHAFNILKLGKYCYYLDATWADSSSTEHNANKNDISYDYFCVPYEEFLQADPNMVTMHRPEKKYYPTLETFRYTNHEYYRFHNAYVTSYDEQKIIDIFVKTAIDHDEETMGNFAVGIRCANPDLCAYIKDQLWDKNQIHRIVSAAKQKLAKNKKAAARFADSQFFMSYRANSSVIRFIWKTADKKKKQ